MAALNEFRSSFLLRRRFFQKMSTRAFFAFAFTLATSLIINTQWRLLMASISEDNGEEAPLQVHLNGVEKFVEENGN
nr:calcium-transporting ATPase 10, plasma membrane-type-like [Tanacetum cinerariifolium]